MKRSRIADFLALIVLWFVVVFILFRCQPAQAEVIDVEKLVYAIGKAENSKTHPYGIMQKYKHTTPKQACANTVKHRLKGFTGTPQAFIKHLAKSYCPLSDKRDTGHLNQYWVKNVSYYYFKGLGA